MRAGFGYYIFTSFFVVNLVELLASRYPVIAYARFLPESENDDNHLLQQLRTLLSELVKADNQLYSKDDVSNVRELVNIKKETPVDQSELNPPIEWNASEAGSHATVHDPHHHHHRHRRHRHKKRRRSLESANSSSNNQQPFLIAKNGAILKRSKHLMLAKPYWPWP